MRPIPPAATPLRAAALFGALALLIALLPGGAHAQVAGSLVGMAADATTGAPLAGVQVTLHAGSDSTALRGTTTGADGRFRLDGVAAGSYRVGLTRLGYARVFLPAQVAAGALDLGTVRMSPAALTLEGVVVTAEAPAVIYAPDRDIYSVAAIPGAAGATVTEVLGKVPDLEVDANGAVTMRGQRPQIQINGRRAPMQGDDLDAFLSQYAAENVESVEVMPNPSARYEAEGSGGIVNIVLRRDARLGTNGNVFANAGTRGESGVGARVTHQGGPLTITGGASLRLNRTDTRTSELRQNLQTDPTTYLQQDAHNERLAWSGSLDLTTEYRLSQRTTVSAETRVGRDLGDSDRTTTFIEMDADRIVTDEYDRSTIGESGGVQGDVALELEHEFATRGHELSLEVEYGVGGDQSESIIRRRLDELNGNLEHLFEVTDDDSRENENEFAIGFDWSRPIGERLQIELGYDGTFARNEDERVRRIGLDGTPEDAVEEHNSGFVQTQALNSLYATTSLRLGQISGQLGLRAEHSDARYDRLEADTFEHEYLSLFPSANLSYPLGEGRRLRLSYSLRTRRPTANVVDPADRSNDPMNRQVGNPDIDPQLTHSVSLDASWSGEIGTLRLAPFYQHTVDEWAQIKSVDPSGISTTTWDNLSSTLSYGSSLTLSLRDVLGVNGNVSLNGQRDIRDYSAVVERAPRNTTRWSLRTNLSGRLPTGSTVSGSMNYTPARETIQGRSSSTVMTTMSLRQQFMNRKLSLNVSLSDPLGIARTSTTTRGTGFVELGRERPSNRRATFSLTYNFGSGGGGGGGRGGGGRGGGGR